MQLRKKRAVVLTPEGVFKRCHADPNWMVGDEIDIPVRQLKMRQVYYSAAAAVILLALITVLYPFAGGSSSHQIVAYVTLDINPSIELGIDKQDIVRSAVGLNADGERIIAQLNLIGKRLDETAAAIIQQVDAAGIISRHIQDDTVEIVVSTTVIVDSAVDEREDGNAQVSVKQSIQAELAALHKDEPVHVSIDEVSTPPDVREEAQKEGISTGKMAVKLLAEQHGITISNEDLNQLPIGKVLQEAGGMSGLLKQIEDAGSTSQVLSELVDKHRQRAEEQQDKQEEFKPSHSDDNREKQDDRPNRPSHDKPERPERPDRGNADKGNEDKPKGKPGRSDKAGMKLPFDLPIEIDRGNGWRQFHDGWEDESDKDDKERERFDEQHDTSEKPPHSNDRGGKQDDEKWNERGQKPGRDKDDEKREERRGTPPVHDKGREGSNEERSSQANHERERRWERDEDDSDRRIKAEDQKKVEEKGQDGRGKGKDRDVRQDERGEGKHNGPRREKDKRQEEERERGYRE